MPTSPTLPLRRQEAIKALGGNVALFKRCEQAGWIKPTVGLYDPADIEKAWQRLRKGDQPEAKK